MPAKAAGTRIATILRYIHYFRSRRILLETGSTQKSLETARLRYSIKALAVFINYKDKLLRDLLLDDED
jgi:hypothetical protein